MRTEITATAPDDSPISQYIYAAIESARAFQEERPEPLPLYRELDAPEAYPLDALGPILGGAAQAMTDIIKSPPALNAQSVLGAACLPVQGHANVLIDGRRFPVSEFFLTLGASGERKSASDAVAIRPHHEHQKRLLDDYKDALARHEADMLDYEEFKASTVKDSKGKPGGALRDALLGLGEEPTAPPYPALLVSDPTMEGIFRMLKSCLPSVGLFSAEGGKLIGGYALSADHQLKTAAGLSALWDGSPFDRARGGDGVEVLYGRRLCLHLLAQPEVADLILGNRMLAAQGILARCLTVYPESRIGTRLYDDRDISANAAVGRYWARMTDLLRTEPATSESDSRELAPRDLTLAADAKTLWVKFHDHVELAQAEGKDLFEIRGFASKTAEHALRLAGILTLVDDIHAGQISRTAMDSGITLAEHYLSEALRLAGSAAVSSELATAEKVLNFIRAYSQEKQTDGLIALRLICQFGPSSVRTVAKAREAVATLERHGWIVPIEGTADIGGKRYREAWRLWS